MRPSRLTLLLAATLALAPGPARGGRGADTLGVAAPGTLEFAPAPPESWPAAGERPADSVAEPFVDLRPVNTSDIVGLEHAHG